MDARKPKTLDDFPQFEVSAVRRGKTSANGNTRFELDGKFDQLIKGTNVNWFWLLIGEKDCLCVTLQSLDQVSLAATLTCDMPEEPQVTGQKLAYLSPYWQAYNVWMVLDASWGWEKKPAPVIDAVAEDYDSGSISIVKGREVRVWTKLEPIGGRTGSSRYYPASN